MIKGGTISLRHWTSPLLLPRARVIITARFLATHINLHLHRTIRARICPLSCCGRRTTCNSPTSVLEDEISAAPAHSSRWRLPHFFAGSSICFSGSLPAPASQASADIASTITGRGAVPKRAMRPSCVSDEASPSTFGLRGDDQGVQRA